jgi:pimeloyl-ACP methyl ester carboxylesterase
MVKSIPVHPLEDDYPLEIIPHIVPVAPYREYPQAIIDERKGVRIAVKQYIPRQASTSVNTTDPITIIAAGGLGFFKELYEPLFAEICQQAQIVGVNIRAIWIADMFNMGESAQANRNNLGCDPAWIDHSRDLWGVVNHFREEMPKPIVGLGHSMGCNQLVCLSSWHPTLFHSLAFIEPGIDPKYGGDMICPWRFQTLQLKECWSDRAEAEARLVKFHKAQTWDEKTSARLKHYGIWRDLQGTGEDWRFATSKHQLVSMLGRHNPMKIGLGPGGIDEMTLEQRELIPDSDPDSWNEGSFYLSELKRAWESLPGVRPWVLYINGGKSPIFGCPRTRDERASRTGIGVGGNGGVRLGAVKQIIVEDGEHGMVFDHNICIVAGHVVDWFVQESERWMGGHRKRLDTWQKKTLEEQQRVRDEYAAAAGWLMEQKRTVKL